MQFFGKKKPVPKMNAAQLLEYGRKTANEWIQRRCTFIDVNQFISEADKRMEIVTLDTIDTHLDIKVYDPQTTFDLDGVTSHYESQGIAVLAEEEYLLGNLFGEPKRFLKLTLEWGVDHD